MELKEYNVADGVHKGGFALFQKGSFLKISLELFP